MIIEIMLIIISPNNKSSYNLSFCNARAISLQNIKMLINEWHTGYQLLIYNGIKLYSTEK